MRILTFPTPNRAYGYKVKWYKKSKKIPFEGIRFAGIADYEEYLTFKFGNYRELPPEEQRKVHPVSDIKLIWAEERLDASHPITDQGSNTD